MPKIGSALNVVKHLSDDVKIETLVLINFKKSKKFFVRVVCTTIYRRRYEFTHFYNYRSQSADNTAFKQRVHVGVSVSVCLARRALTQRVRISCTAKSSLRAHNGLR